MEDIREIVDNLILELRRGTLVLSVLSQMREPRYGYSLVEFLNGKGISIEPGTLYPLLRRLEKQGLLSSEWETSTAKPRKYYVLSETGKDVYQKLCQEWKTMTASIDGILI
ncbi:MAG: PadR family transcriptional regulator [Sphaerochaetaceae bacterium]